MACEDIEHCGRPTSKNPIRGSVRDLPTRAAGRRSDERRILSLSNLRDMRPGCANHSSGIVAMEMRSLLRENTELDQAAARQQVTCCVDL